MTHGDDDGLVLPPRLAPQHVVILPIYRNDEERAGRDGILPEAAGRIDGPATMPARRCGRMVDDRDLPRADKKWQQVKRGVPITVEVGPRDVAGDSLMPRRRDVPPGEKKPAIARGQFVAGVAAELAAMQQNLFERAAAERKASTRMITQAGRLRGVLHAQECRQSRDSRRVCHLPLRRRARGRRGSGPAQGDDSLHSGGQ